MLRDPSGGVCKASESMGDFHESIFGFGQKSRAAFGMCLAPLGFAFRVGSMGSHYSEPLEIFQNTAWWLVSGAGNLSPIDTKKECPSVVRLEI